MNVPDFLLPTFLVLSAQSHLLIFVLASLYTIAVILAVAGWRSSKRQWTTNGVDKQPLDYRIAATNEVIMLNLYGDNRNAN